MMVDSFDITIFFTEDKHFSPTRTCLCFAVQYLSYDAFNTGRRQPLIIRLNNPFKQVVPKYFKDHTHIWRNGSQGLK